MALGPSLDDDNPYVNNAGNYDPPLFEWWFKPQGKEHPVARLKEAKRRAVRFQLPPVPQMVKGEPLEKATKKSVQVDWLWASSATAGPVSGGAPLALGKLTALVKPGGLFKTLARPKCLGNSPRRAGLDGPEFVVFGFSGKQALPISL